MISKGDWGDILVIGRMSPDLVTSNWRCFIIASNRSFSFCNCRSSWLTICSCTRVWAMVLSSKVCAELRCLCKWNWNKYTQWIFGVSQNYYSQIIANVLERILPFKCPDWSLTERTTRVIDYGSIASWPITMTMTEQTNRWHAPKAATMATPTATAIQVVRWWFLWWWCWRCQYVDATTSMWWWYWRRF